MKDFDLENKQFKEMIDSVGINPNHSKYAGVLLKDFNIIWNAAIEAAANKAEGYSYGIGVEIRKLKK